MKLICRLNNIYSVIINTPRVAVTALRLTVILNTAIITAVKKSLHESEKAAGKDCFLTAFEVSSISKEKRKKLRTPYSRG